MLHRLGILLLLLSALGCEPPKVDLVGDWVDGEVRLALAKDKTFTLTEDGHSLSGSYSKVGTVLYLQPNALDGKSQDAVNLQAMDDAIKLGKQTDLVTVSYRFEPREFTVEDADTLRMKSVPPPPGVEPMPLRVLKRVQSPPVN